MLLLLLRLEPFECMLCAADKDCVLPSQRFPFICRLELIAKLLVAGMVPVGVVFAMRLARLPKGQTAVAIDVERSS